MAIRRSITPADAVVGTIQGMSFEPRVLFELVLEKVLTNRGVFKMSGRVVRKSGALQATSIEEAIKEFKKNIGHHQAC